MFRAIEYPELKKALQKLMKDAESDVKEKKKIEKLKSLIDANHANLPMSKT